MVELLVGWAALPLRLILGMLFMNHGYPKLFKDFKGTVKMVQGIGFKPGGFWAFWLGFAEFFGGLAILLGFATRIGAVLIGIVMLIALYLNKVTWKKPMIGGYELVLIYLAALITLYLLGAGNLSIDSIIGWNLG